MKALPPPSARFRRAAIPWATGPEAGRTSAPSALWPAARSPDMLDPELVERPAGLGETVAVDLAGFRRPEIMRAAIRVEAHRQAMFAQHLAQGPEGRGRAFLLDEKGRVDRPRRVVERDDEIQRGLAFEPRLPRAVLRS